MKLRAGGDREAYSILKKIWHPSRTLRTQELQNASAVPNSEEDLTPLSHFMCFGFPKGLPKGSPSSRRDSPKKAIPESLPKLVQFLVQFGRIGPPGWSRRDLCPSRPSQSRPQKRNKTLRKAPECERCAQL